MKVVCVRRGPPIESGVGGEAVRRSLSVRSIDRRLQARVPKLPFPLSASVCMDVGTIFSGGVDLDSTLTSPPWHHHRAEKRAGHSTCNSLGSSDLAKARASFFFVAGPLGVARVIFPTPAEIN